MGSVIRTGMRVGGLAFLLGAALSGTPPAQDRSERFTPVREVIRDGIARGLAPSVAVAVVEEGRTVWAEGFGLANQETGLAASAETPYLLASVSKPITATGLMLLVDRGQVDLDRPVNDYLPRAKVRAPLWDPGEITVRRLANHTGGLPEHWSFFYGGEAPPSMDLTIERYGFAATRPGTRWQYSNLAFGILEYVTELVADRPWAEFLATQVFGPIGMARSAAGLDPSLRAEAAVPYELDAAGRFRPVGDYDFDHRGASACWSSARDLARFVMFHLADGELEGQRLLRTQTVREMRAAREPSRNGVGWFVGQVRGQRAFWHTGGMPGVSTLVRGWPEARAGIVILTNTDRREMTNRVASRLEHLLFPAGRNPPAGVGGDGQRPKAPEFGAASGRLVIHGEAVEVALEQPDGRFELRLGSRRFPVADVRWDGRRFRGRVQARLPAREDYKGVMALGLDLRVRRNLVYGVCTARAERYHALPHWVELRRR